MSSIEKSRQNYQEIIGSFKNISDKLEQWHKQRDSGLNNNVSNSYTSLVQQYTAKFDWNKSEPDNQEFLYEFERQSDSQRSSQLKSVQESKVFKRIPSFSYQQEDDSDKENVGTNFNNTFDSRLQPIKKGTIVSRNLLEAHQNVQRLKNPEFFTWDNNFAKEAVKNENFISDNRVQVHNFKPKNFYYERDSCNSSQLSP
jgi:hypothetical protein